MRVPDPGSPYPEFHQTYTCATRIRADIAFGEQVLNLADHTSDDWSYNEKTGKLSVNRDVVLRSRVRVEARQFQMCQLHRETWGEKAQTETHVNVNLLSKEELMQKARELIGMIDFINAPPPQPPPLAYRGEEAPDDDPEPAGIGRQPRPVTG